MMVPHEFRQEALMQRLANLFAILLGGGVPVQLPGAGHGADRRRDHDGNANVSTTCQLACSTQQLICQTNCAQNSPSQ
jgi:hypothetical protein